VFYTSLKRYGCDGIWRSCDGLYEFAYDAVLAKTEFRTRRELIGGEPSKVRGFTTRDGVANAHSKVGQRDGMFTWIVQGCRALLSEVLSYSDHPESPWCERHARAECDLKVAGDCIGQWLVD